MDKRFWNKGLGGIKDEYTRIMEILEGATFSDLELSAVKEKLKARSEQLGKLKGPVNKMVSEFLYDLHDLMKPIEHANLGNIYKLCETIGYGSSPHIEKFLKDKTIMHGKAIVHEIKKNRFVDITALKQKAKASMKKTESSLMIRCGTELETIIAEACGILRPGKTI